MFGGDANAVIKVIRDIKTIVNNKIFSKRSRSIFGKQFFLGREKKIINRIKYEKNNEISFIHLNKLKISVIKKIKNEKNKNEFMKANLMLFSL